MRDGDGLVIGTGENLNAAWNVAGPPDRGRQYCHGRRNLRPHTTPQVWNVVHVLEHDSMYPGVEIDLALRCDPLLELPDRGAGGRGAGKGTRVDHADDWSRR